MVEIGARWWKFDFHTHSPASVDYGKHDQGSKGAVTERQWLEAFVQQGIECVAITDHNSGAWIDGLKEAAAALRQEGVVIHLFPGVEITANGNIHILGIFDPEKTSADIAAVVGAAGFRGVQGDSNAVASCSAETVVEEIIKFGGVAIPAHIDMPAGMCQVQSAHTINQICEKASAVEIVFPSGGRDASHDALLQKYRNQNLELAEVIGSDAHGAGAVGRAFTWVKMSSPTIEGLRLALVDGGSSIRTNMSEPGNPNAFSSCIIKKVSITKAKYCGRGTPLEIKFNPWLNSIIGGRGSGKSSVLEFIRIGLGRDADLQEIFGRSEVRETFLNFAKKSVGRDSDGVLLDDTIVDCFLVKDAVEYMLRWAASGGGVTICRNSGGSWIPEHGDVRSRFPIKIFSQKQIYDLAKNPSSLLRLIDEASGVDAVAWKMRWSEAETYFYSLNSRRRELEGRISYKGTLLGQLEDVSRKIELIESSGHAKVLSDFNSASAKSKSIEEFIARYRELAIDLANVLEKSKNLVLDSSVFGGHGGDSEVLSEITKLQSAYEKLKVEVSSSIAVAEQQANSFSQYLVSSEFARARDLAVSEYNQLVASLASSGVENPGQYQHLIAEKAGIQDKLKEVGLLEEELTKAKEDSDRAYNSLVGLRKELTSRRSKFIKDNFSNNSSIDLRLEPLRNSSDMESSFRSVIGRPDGAFSSDIYDEEKASGILFGLIDRLSGFSDKDIDDDAELSKIFSVLHDFKCELLNYQSARVFDRQFGKRFMDFMAQLEAQGLDRIVTWFPDDNLVIKYHDGRRLKEISQGSAGQKAATILSFLLSYGEEPLILDQPEDDLDNGLISSLVVKKLQENKSRRQIIVATHNPNIVVNGDSELVVALQDKGNIEVLACGGLQEFAVRREVCEIMEGGKQALQQRYRRMIAV